MPLNINCILLHNFAPMKKSSLLFLFLAFGCIGITTEIFFTAISDAIIAIQEGQAINWRLIGQSYIWMFPIYGLAGASAPAIYGAVKQRHALVRWAFYGILILGVEFVAGALMHLTIGRCPWEYSAGWHIMGFIRLDYYPLWAIFGIMLESIYIALSEKLH